MKKYPIEGTVYYLGDLNRKQDMLILDWLGEKDDIFKKMYAIPGDFLFYVHSKWYISNMDIRVSNIINALELF